MTDETSAAGSREPLPEIIDTHTHFYDPTRPQGVPWPGRDDPVLYRPVLPPEFRALARPLGVTGTVVVEASPWVEDNQWLLDLAEREPIILGVVGSLTPGEAEFRSHLRRFARNPLFRGIRIGGGTLGAVLDRPAFVDDLRALADHGLALDVNGTLEMLPAVARLGREVRGLTVVINHLANVKVDGKAPPATWKDGMRAAAACPSVYCKVSALVEGTGRTDGSAPAGPDRYRRVLDAARDAFGEDRLLYGSNWPVSARFAPYAVAQGIVTGYLRGRERREAGKWLHDNAVAAYRLKAR